MTPQPPQSPGPGQSGAPDQPTEEELRAALEAEMKQVTIDDLLLQSVVSLINLTGRRLALAPGSQDELDLAQARTGIEGVRALLPLLEPRHSDQLGPVRDALSQLQMAYARHGGGEGDAPAKPSSTTSTAGGGAPGGGAGGRPEPPPKREPGPGTSTDTEGGGGPAQRSGRLWIPGQ